MYADDLLILSATVNGLQHILNCCNSVSTELELEFNCKKCICTALGPASNYFITDMNLGRELITCSFKYLGVTFISGKKLIVDIDIIKRNFLHQVTAFWVMPNA